MYPFIHPSVHLSIHPSIHQSIHSSIQAFIQTTTTHSSIHASIHLPIHYSTIHPFIPPHTFTSIHNLSSHQSTNAMYVLFLLCPSTHASIHPSIHSLTHPFRNQSFHLFSLLWNMCLKLMQSNLLAVFLHCEYTVHTQNKYCNCC